MDERQTQCFVQLLGVFSDEDLLRLGRRLELNGFNESALVLHEELVRRELIRLKPPASG